MVVAGCETPEASSTGATLTPTPSPTLTPSPSPSPTATPAPTPSPSPTPLAAGTYLALGDSLAVGVGASQPAETGYVGRLFRDLSESDLATTALLNLAVSGETSTSMIRTGQLASALDAISTADPQVAIVTLDIGGNDLLRLIATEPCASAPQGADCLQQLALTLTDFEASYRQILGELVDALPASATLAVMTYFNPFSGTDASYEAAGELALLGTDGRLDCAADDPRARGMNDVIACVGEDLGAVPVDVQPGFAGLGLELTHIGAQDIHANDAGYELIADQFLDAIRP